MPEKPIYRRYGDTEVDKTLIAHKTFRMSEHLEKERRVMKLFRKKK
jgi:hypothetical protein